MSLTLFACKTEEYVGVVIIKGSTQEEFANTRIKKGEGIVYAADALKKVCDDIGIDIQIENGVITSVKGLKNGDDEGFKWVFYIGNNKIEKSVNEYELKGDDVILLYYE